MEPTIHHRHHPNPNPNPTLTLTLALSLSLSLTLALTLNPDPDPDPEPEQVSPSRGAARTADTLLPMHGQLVQALAHPREIRRSMQSGGP